MIPPIGWVNRCQTNAPALPVHLTKKNPPAVVCPSFLPAPSSSPLPDTVASTSSTPSSDTIRCDPGSSMVSGMAEAPEIGVAVGSCTDVEVARVAACARRGSKQPISLRRSTNASTFLASSPSRRSQLPISPKKLACSEIGGGGGM